jgi:glycine cleavage system H protein
MMSYPEGYYFTREHEWVKIEDQIAYVGLTELAVKELEEIISIDIHTVGLALYVDQAFGRIKSRKFLCKLIMPFPGKIIEVNSKFTDDPELINGPFNPDHWIVKIDLESNIDQNKLLTFLEYKNHKKQNVLHMVKYLLSLGSNA